LNPRNPVQLVDRVITHFKKYLERPKKQQHVQFSLTHLVSPLYKLKSEEKADKFIMTQVAQV
jgi:hypothetical protein